MDQYPIPVFAAQDYEAFRRLLGSDLPDTYDEWLQFHERKTRQLLQVGQDVRAIEIHPDEFYRFCAARGTTANGKTLLDFAAEKHAGNSY